MFIQYDLSRLPRVSAFLDTENNTFYVHHQMQHYTGNYTEGKEVKEDVVLLCLARMLD
jgi:hypothetical protein